MANALLDGFDSMVKETKPKTDTLISDFDAMVKPAQPLKLPGEVLGFPVIGISSSNPIHYGTHAESGVGDISGRAIAASGRTFEDVAQELAGKGYIAAVRRAGQRGITNDHIHFADPQLAPTEANRLRKQSASNKFVYLPAAESDWVKNLPRQGTADQMVSAATDPLGAVRKATAPVKAKKPTKQDAINADFDKVLAAMQPKPAPSLAGDPLPLASESGTTKAARAAGLGIGQVPIETKAKIPEEIKLIADSYGKDPRKALEALAMRHAGGGGTGSIQEDMRQLQAELEDPGRIRSDINVISGLFDTTRDVITENARDVANSGIDSGEIKGKGHKYWHTAINRALHKGWLSADAALQLNRGDVFALAKDLEAQEKIDSSKSYQAFNKSKGVGAALRSLAADPITVTSELVSESLASMAPGLLATSGASLLASAMGGPAAGLAVSSAGAGANSAYVETASQILDTLKASGVDTKDPLSLQRAFSDIPTYRKIRNNALTKGITVGVFDAVSAGLAGKLWGAAGKGVFKQVLAGAKEIGWQAGMGMAGEAVSEVATGQPLSVPSILGEGIGEIGPGAVETAIGVEIRNQGKGGGQSTNTEIANPWSISSIGGNQTSQRISPAGELAARSIAGNFSKPQEQPTESAKPRTVEAVKHEQGIIRTLLDQASARGDEVSTKLWESTLHELRLEEARLLAKNPHTPAQIAETIPEPNQNQTETIPAPVELSGNTGELAPAPSALPSVAHQPERVEPMGNIDFEPERFQYKEANPPGSTRYNRQWADAIDVWRDPADGRLKVINGHKRYAWALRDGEQDIKVREVEGLPDVASARVYGALKNITQGTGKPTDAARLFRDTGLSQEILSEQGIDIKAGLARTANGLAKLNDTLWNDVVTGRLTENRGALIGEMIPNQDDQAIFTKSLKELEQKGHSITDAKIIELVNDIRAGASSGGSQTGFNFTIDDNMAHRADISVYILSELKKDKAAFKKAVDIKTRVERGGNQIDAETSARIAKEAEQIGEIFNTLRNQKGEVADIIQDGARRIANGEEASTVKKEIYNLVSDRISGDIAAGNLRSLVSTGERPGTDPAGLDTPAANSEPAATTVEPAGTAKPQLVFGKKPDKKPVQGSMLETPDDFQLVSTKAKNAVPMPERKPTDAETGQTSIDVTTEAPAPSAAGGQASGAYGATDESRTRGDSGKAANQTTTRAGGKRSAAQPVSERDVVKVMVDASKILYRKGRMGPTSAVGQYKEKSGIGRAKNIYDIPTAAHEVGHKLGYDYGWTKDPSLLGELEPFANPDKLGSQSSWVEGAKPSVQLREGIAEYIRLYVTDPAVARAEAPLFTQKFEAALADSGALKKFMQAQAQYADYEAQSGVQKLRGVTDYGNRVAKGIEKQKKWHGFRTDLVDDLFPIRALTEDIFGRRTEDVPPSQNPYFKARMSRGASAWAEQLITQGFDDITGLEEIIHISGDKTPMAANFQDYARARRLKAYAEADRPTGAMSTDEINEVIAQYGSPEFEQAFDELQKMYTYLLDVESNFYSPRARMSWAQTPDYVSMNRVVEHGIGETSERGGTGSDKGIANKSQTYKAYSGKSHALYEPWLDTLIGRIYKSTQRAMQNDAMISLVDMLNSSPAHAKEAERIPPTAIPHDIGKMLEKALDQMEGGQEIIEQLPDEIFDLQYWQEIGLTGKMKNARIVFLMRKGRPEFYQIRDKVLYDSIVAMPSKAQHIAIKVLGAPAHTLRTAIVSDPGFLLYTNLIRDSLHSFMVTPGFIPFYDTLKSVPQAAMGGPEADMLARTGGAMAGTAAMDRAQVRKQAKNIAAVGTSKEGIQAAGAHYVEGVRKIRDTSEMTNRIAVYKRELADVQQKHPEWSESDHIAYAAYRSRDLIDFAMKGRLTAEATQMIAFARSKINGMAKMSHEAARNPRRVLAAGAAMAAATAVLYYLNRDDKDYQELGEWERNNYWHVKPMSGREFIRIPKPHEWGLVFGTAMEDSLRMLDGDRAAFASYPDALQSVVSMDMPNALQLMTDLAGNRQNYSGAPIVAEYLESGSSKVNPEDQYSGSTSPTAKAIGKRLGRSPAKIEYAFKQLGGPPADVTTALIDWITSPITGEGPRKSVNPLRRAVTSVNAYPDAVDKLRDHEKQARMDFNSVKRVDGLKARDARAKELGYDSLKDLVRKAKLTAAALKAMRPIEDDFYAEDASQKDKYKARDLLQARARQALTRAGYDVAFPDRKKK